MAIQRKYLGLNKITPTNHPESNEVIADFEMKKYELEKRTDSPTDVRSSKVYLNAMSTLQSRLRECEQENLVLRENQSQLQKMLELSTQKYNDSSIMFSQLEKCLTDKLQELEYRIRQRNVQVLQCQEDENYKIRNEDNLMHETQLKKKQIQIDSLENLLARYKNQNKNLDGDFISYKMNTNQTFHQSPPKGRNHQLPSHKQDYKQQYHDTVQAIQLQQDELDSLTDLYEHNFKHIKNSEYLNHIEELIQEKYQKLNQLSELEEEFLLKI